MNRILPAASVSVNIAAQQRDEYAKFVGRIYFWAFVAQASPVTRIHHIRRLLAEQEATK